MRDADLKHHHHVPEPVPVRGKLTIGVVEIVDTSAGERMRLTLSGASRAFDEASVEIDGVLARGSRVDQAGARYESDRAPLEPHEFSAMLKLRRGQDSEDLLFSMREPDHHHAHAGRDH